MPQSIKRRVYGILEPGDADSRYFDPFIMGLIVLNVVAVILETEEGIYSRYSDLFTAFEWFSVAVFTVEYLLRVWSITLNPKFSHPARGRLRYMATPFAIIDLIAILPFYLPLVIPHTMLDLRFVRALRLFRIFRILKLARYSESLRTFDDVLRSRKEELMVTFFTIMILLVVASSLVYEAEHEAQPDAFSSIPAAMWWGIVTLATVGYGDMYPVTPAGRLIGSLVAILGIGLFALPTGILASGFAEEMQRKKKAKEERETGNGKMERAVCPHCGRYIDEEPQDSPCKEPGRGGDRDDGRDDGREAAALEAR